MSLAERWWRNAAWIDRGREQVFARRVAKHREGAAPDFSEENTRISRRIGKPVIASHQRAG